MSKQKFKMSVCNSDISIITGQKVNEVIEDKLRYICDLTMKNPPYIYWISKMVMMSGGKVFNNLPADSPIKIPMIAGYNQLKHLAINYISDKEQMRLIQRYGIALKWPPLGLFSVIQDSFRNIQDNLQTLFPNVIMAPCHGYIDDEGKLKDPGWNKNEKIFNSNAISGYLFWKIDDIENMSPAREIIQYLKDSKTSIVFKRQVERVKYTAPRIYRSRIDSSLSQHQLAGQRLDRIHGLNKLITNEKIEDWNLLKSENEIDESFK